MQISHLTRNELIFTLKLSRKRGGLNFEGKGKITVAAPFRNRRVPYYIGILVIINYLRNSTVVLLGHQRA
jgi:hypothetical protein